MGLNKGGLRILIREHKKKRFEEPILTLGRECVYATVDEIKKILVSEGLKPADIDPNLSLITNIPDWQNTPKAKYTSDVVFFNLMGIKEIYALDISDYEKPDYMWDINIPIPIDMENRFGIVIDSGTMEHIFDVRSAFANIFRLLKIGGRIIHMSPASNYIGHSLYQFTPGLFYDYYNANKFTDLRCFIMEHSVRKPERIASKLYKCGASNYNCLFISSKRLAVIFHAEKTPSSTYNVIPYQGVIGDAQSESPVSSLKFQRIKKFVPLFIWRFVRSVVYLRFRNKAKVYEYIGKI
ncbi:class I SAM-dependent methyltransferase [bacterium]|nr:class I SAM-dependent methyltransferase [bacterium]MBU3956602.1 class I SAM-dependent methyltransferase [bacterium]